MTVQRITVDDVRRSINPNVRAHYSVRWMGRPIGNALTPMFYNFGYSAGGVTVFRAGLAGVGLMLLCTPYHWGGAVAALIYYVCFILDCVDGNLARLRGTVSYWGKFIDGLADFVFVIGAPLAAGLSLSMSGGGLWWLVLGSLVTIMSLTSQMVRSRLSFMREWMVNQSGPVSDAATEAVSAPRETQKLAAAIYVNGTYLAPLLLFLPEHGRTAFLVCMVPAMLMSEFVWLIATLAEARTLLDRPRRSIHAAIDGDEQLVGRR